jgi:hypothetical protein
MIPRDELPVFHRSIADLLPHGRDNAIRSDVFQRNIRLPDGKHPTDVAVRLAIKELIQRYGWPIGSSPSPPPGFYLIRTREEADEAVAQLMSRAKSILARVSVLKSITMKEAVGQLSLFVERNKDP